MSNFHTAELSPVDVLTVVRRAQSELLSALAPSTNSRERGMGELWRWTTPGIVTLLVIAMKTAGMLAGEIVTRLFTAR